LVTKTIAGVSVITGVAFTDSNLATVMVVGDTTTNTVVAAGANSSPDTFIAGDTVVIGTDTGGASDKLSIDTDGTHLLDDLFLVGKTVDPITGGNTVTGVSVTFTGTTTPATSPSFTERRVEAQRVADSVVLICRIAFSSFTGATGNLRVVMASPFPAPTASFVPTAVVTFGATAGAANPFTMTTGGPPNGVNIVARLTSTTTIDFFEDRTDGSTIPVDASSVGSDPHVNAAGDFMVVITYFTTTT